MAYFLLQKQPGGQSAWDDVYGNSYNFAQRLANARSLCENDTVFFYRPENSGTTEDGCVFATAVVAAATVGDRVFMDACLRDYVVIGRPVPLAKVGDARRNAQRCFQTVTRQFVHDVLEASGDNEGAPR
ncbi:MAG: hypothetical protein ABIP13_08500 [Tepidiformaceae bacterium]